MKENIQKNLPLAAFYYKSTAENGDLFSQLRLAELYEGVDDFNKDLELRFFWLFKAAEQGDLEASYKLALAYLSGQGVEVDRNQELSGLKKVATKDYEDAAWRLVQLIDLEQNHESFEAYGKYLKLAADKDNPDAAVLYAEFIMKNGLDDTSLLIVVEYLEKAIERENAEAMFQMAALLSNKALDIFEPNKSLHLYTQAARLGYLDAQLLLGSIYNDSDVSIYNPQKAFEFYRAAAKQGNPEGLYFYAEMLLSGRGTGANFKAAAESLIIAAEKGYAPAQFLLGNLYEKGKELHNLIVCF